MLGGGQFYFPTIFSFVCFVSSLRFNVAHSLLFWPLHLGPCTVCAFNHLVLTVFLSHRRIDVSPRAFKKHSQLFEAMKSSEDGTYKVTEHFAV